MTAAPRLKQKQAKAFIFEFSQLAMNYDPKYLASLRVKTRWPLGYGVQ